MTKPPANRMIRLAASHCSKRRYWSMPPEAWVNHAVALLIAPAASEASIKRSLTSRFTAAVTAAV
jgi:hypothetical protein